MLQVLHLFPELTLGSQVHGLPVIFWFQVWEYADSSYTNGRPYISSTISSVADIVFIHYIYTAFRHTIMRQYFWFSSYLHLLLYRDSMTNGLFFLDNVRQSCPCAYLIKHYVMKVYRGVDV
jgi:hypothetical protein